MRIWIITAICLALAVPAWAGLYKWTDDSGKVHYSDSLSKVPMDQRDKDHIQKMKSDKKGSRMSRPKAAAPAPARKHLGAKKHGSPSRDTGIDKQRVNDLQRLIQKKHYNH